MYRNARSQTGLAPPGACCDPITWLTGPRLNYLFPVITVIFLLVCSRLSLFSSFPFVFIVSFCCSCLLLWRRGGRGPGRLNCAVVRRGRPGPAPVGGYTWPGARPTYTSEGRRSTKGHHAQGPFRGRAQGLTIYPSHASGSETNPSQPNLKYKRMKKKTMGNFPRNKLICTTPLPTASLEEKRARINCPSARSSS